MRAATYLPTAMYWIFGISIHAAHAGSDCFRFNVKVSSLRISIHAAHAGSDGTAGSDCILSVISIHAAHAGSDFRQSSDKFACSPFQSTLPMRAATLWYRPYVPSGQISIHAAHAGSDYYAHRFRNELMDFNPRCPCGQRPQPVQGQIFRQSFQSTLPMRAATGMETINCLYKVISIHAAHAGSDLSNNHLCC